MQHRRLMGLALGLLCLCSTLAQAQSADKNRTCRTPYANRSGTTKQDIAVSTSAVPIIAKNPNLCGALVINKTSNAVRCMSMNDGVPTSVAGHWVRGDSALVLAFEAQVGWRCIRDAGAAADSVVSVEELEP